MLLPGVTAASLPTQNDETWDGLQEGTDEEFDEATQAYVEVCNNSAVRGAATPPAHSPRVHMRTPLRPSDASSAHQGRAVLAASHPIWVAEQFVSGQISLPLSTALSSAFPLTTQAYYDSVVEPIGAMWTQSLVSLSARAPHWALVATTFATDVLLVAGMGFFALVVCSKAFIICAAVAALGRRLASPRKQSC